MEVGRRTASLTMQPASLEKRGRLVLRRVLCRFVSPTAAMRVYVCMFVGRTICMVRVCNITESYKQFILQTVWNKWESTGVGAEAHSVAV